MMRNLTYSLVLLLSMVVCCAFAQQTTNPVKMSVQDWDARVRASADSQKQARQVILDAIYAKNAPLVADSFERMYNEKPISDVRFANFVYAAAVAECNRKQEDKTYKTAFSHAFKALGEAGFPEKGGSATGKATGPMGKMSNAWLAWGHILIRFGLDRTGAAASYKQALKLDPSLAEAYLWWAEMVISPYEKPYHHSHAKIALEQLDRAEQLEPKLRPLVIYVRAYIALGAGDERKNYAKALPLLKEYLKLWPETPLADIMHKMIVHLEEYLAKP